MCGIFYLRVTAEEVSIGVALPAKIGYLYDSKGAKEFDCAVDNDWVHHREEQLIRQSRSRQRRAGTRMLHCYSALQ